MSQLFQTQDTPLAITLLTCGVPVPLHPVQQLPMPFINVYDPKILRDLGYGGGKWTIEDAVRDAWKNNRPGTIFYNFERNERLERIVAAWNKQKIAIRQQASLSGTGGQPIGECQLDEVEAAKFACQLFHNRKQTIEDWRLVSPFILIPGETSSEQETDGEGRTVIVTVGSYRGYFLDCTPEDRRHLRI